MNIQRKIKSVLVAMVVLLGAVSLVSAGPVISVVATDIGQSAGRLGTTSDPLQVGDKIGLDIVLHHNTYPGFPSYDGYLLYGMDLDLAVTGPATLGVNQILNKSGQWFSNDLVWAPCFSVVGMRGVTCPPPYMCVAYYEDLIVNNAINSIYGGSLGGCSANGGDLVLLSGLWLEATGNGIATADLSIAGTTQYALHQYPDGSPYPTGWLDANDSDLGDLTIYIGSGSVPPPVVDTEVVPTNPASSDPVSVILSSDWPNACIPMGSLIWASGNNIMIDIVVPPQEACATVSTPWERTISVGRLPAGTYNVYVKLSVPPYVDYTKVEEFVVSATAHHVDADATGADDGSSWIDAFTSLPYALGVALSGDEIRVAQGTYRPNDGVFTTPEFDVRELTFQLKTGVTVKGGYAGVNGAPIPGIRDIGLYKTILTGAIGEPADTNNSYHVVQGEDDSILDGFTITNGYSVNATPGLDSYGAGMLNHEDTNVTVINCTFKNNSARFGGGMYNYESDVTLINCTFYDNSAAYNGGALREVIGTSTITNCTFNNNQADTLGAGYFGGGMNIFNSDSDLLNCIFWDNSDVNGINESAQIHSVGGTLLVAYTCIQGLDTLAGAGNIDVDPCFVDPCNGDFHLKSEGWRWDKYMVHDSYWKGDDVTSRCIDAGNPGALLGEELLTIPDDPNRDWGENLRINMGAYGGTAQASMPPYDWTLLGDLSNNGTVGYEDLEGQVGDWQTTASEQPGDLNRDGIVDMIDYRILAQDWMQMTDWAP